MLALVISSNKKYEPIHLGRLVKNIKTTDIPLDKVYIIIGGCEEEAEENIDGIHVFRVKNNSFDYTAMQFICKNPEKIDFNYCFYTHDTVVFGPEFYKKASAIMDACIANNCDTSPVVACISDGLSKMSFNIGWYKKKVILSGKEELLGYLYNENNDRETLWKCKLRAVEYEDFLFKRNTKYNVEKQSLNYIRKAMTQNNEWIDVRIRKFDYTDFSKFQTNFEGLITIDTFSDFPANYNIY